MSKFGLTPMQQAAVDCDADDILVSAAAGSGKTRVLTERVIRHLRQGVKLDELLVVTFTEAASAEMKERIAAGIEGDTQLGMQAKMLHSADISTIHSFCSKLIREYFHLVDVDPAFKIADEAELGLVSAQVMEDLFDSEYERKDNEAFKDLVDVYGGKTMDGRLEVIVRGIYSFMVSDPFPERALRRCAAMYEDAADLDGTRWAEITREELLNGLGGAVECLDAVFEICRLPGGPANYIENLEQNRDMLLSFMSIVKNEDFSEIYIQIKNPDWGRLKRISAKDEVDPDLKERAQKIRDRDVKGRVEKLLKGVLFAPPDKMLADIRALAPRVAALMDLTLKYSQAFSHRKREMNILDFNDLEHFAIRILYPGGPDDMTPRLLERMYYEVLIDEYQDSNEVQDLILSAVAARRFMVGDVKQSIYRFRRANPGLFLDKYRRYEVLGTGDVRLGDRTPVRIDLSQNFRSLGGVIEGVNFFFRLLMDEGVGEVAYDESARLYAGREERDATGRSEPLVWVEVLDGAGAELEQGDDSDEGDEGEDVSSIVAETRLLARTVCEILETRDVWDDSLKVYRRCGLDDIAVLARGLSSGSSEIIAELKRFGIDAVADISEGFFDRHEVKLAMAFMNIIDNPKQDIPLAAVLYSVVYGFSLDDLYAIKTGGVGECLYEKLVSVNDTVCPGLALRVSGFLDGLAAWRDAAVNMPVSRLIGYVFDATNFPAYMAGMPDGALREANLRMFIDYADRFERAGFTGLFNFVKYMERLRDSGRAVGAAEPVAGSGKLRLMTIHKSKGLEFPVVICAFLGKQFNREDERRPVMLHQKEGIGAFYVDTERRVRSNTLSRFSLGSLNARESRSEEMRCLYVAMTRARDLLVLMGRVKDYKKAAEGWSGAVRTGIEGALPFYYRRGAGSYLDWVMGCVERGDLSVRVRVHGIVDGLGVLGDEGAADRVTLPVIVPVSREVYGTTLPSKLSISEIRRIYDVTPDSTLHHHPAPVFEPPEFLKVDEGITPTRLGSVIHKIVEHLDYHEHRTEQAIRDLLDELVDGNFILPDEAAAVDAVKIAELVNSSVGERLRNAGKVHRETPFVLSLPAKRVYRDLPPAEQDEAILVHGIVDCHFLESDEYVILDFKSDFIPHGVTLKAWAVNHRTQMEIYREAITQGTGRKVREVLLYSFYRGEVVMV